ncbi:YslB family protein [Fredinandcohnia quinoae]|uniref:YslB family protein n=1 Tax=Fredinandcohnia quinoae TaxID=2918902 RepID=A0AAW5EDZ4_9BACI|nr:YslB family protein [Fredinandcohnia sp. SECRCQ15]MCH1627955.1 YslB family protein [Fredinandcohnia sp. SECRCQ15]
MNNENINQLKEFSNEQMVSVFGYELIREILLPDILGKETPQLLYWGGKNLARKFPLPTLEEIVSFFSDAGWGQLTIEKSEKNHMEFHLTSEMISTRFKHKDTMTYQLESGFLAQQIQQQRGQLTESYEQQKKRANKVIFTVKWDQKDITED